MLELWRRSLGFAPRRAGCSVTVYEGVDYDDLIERRMRQWYLHLLDTADPRLLPTADLASKAAVSIGEDSDWAVVALPDEARRPLSVRLRGWLADAKVITPLEADHAVARMASPYAKPGPRTPLAVFDGHSIRVTPRTGIVDSLIAVVDLGEDEYILDSSLLSTIPTTF